MPAAPIARVAANGPFTAADARSPERSEAHVDASVASMVAVHALASLPLRHGAVIDASFAAERNVKLGDPVVVNPHRFATRFEVVGELEPAERGHDARAHGALVHAVDVTKQELVVERSGCAPST